MVRVAGFLGCRDDGHAESTMRASRSEVPECLTLRTRPFKNNRAIWRVVISEIKMKFFKSIWTTDEDRAVEGHRPYSLPLVTCPYCGNFRGQPGLTYPWIIIKGAVDPQIERDMRYGSAADMSWEVFLKVRECLRVKLGSDYPVAPGSGFGAFRGKLFKRPELTSFIMPESDILLARASDIGKLAQAGCQIQFFETEIAAGKTPEGLVEIWAPPVAESARQSDVEWCSFCERGGASLDVLRGSSVPSGVHVFKLRDRPNFICFSEKFLALTEEFGFGGIKWEPLALV